MLFKGSSKIYYSICICQLVAEYQTWAGNFKYVNKNPHFVHHSFKLAIKFFENIKAVAVTEGYEGHSCLLKRMDPPELKMMI